MKNYIQIGSNIGLDHFHQLCNNLRENSNIHLIEPNSRLIPTLKSNYSDLIKKHNVSFHPIGIVTPNSSQVNSLKLYKDALGRENSGLSSILNRRSHQMIYDEIEFCGILFSKFCEDNSIREIEMLSIDTEGLDYEILDNIDLKHIDIKTIYFEKWDFESDDLDGIVETGSIFLERILDKYKEYSLTELLLDGQPSYCLERV